MNWYSLALISACFIALYDILQKKILTREHSFDLLAASSLAMLVMSLPMLFSGKVVAITSTAFMLTFIKSVFAVSSLIFATRSLRHMDVSEYAPLMNLSPVFLLFMSIFFLGESFSVSSLFGFILITGGAYIVESKDGLLSPIKKMYTDKYMHFLFFAFIFLSLSAIMDKFILSGGVPLDSFFFYNRLISAFLLFMVSSLLYNGYSDILMVFKRSFIPVITVAALYMSADYVYYMATKDPASKIALIVPLKRLSTLLVTVVGGEFFKEDNIGRKTIACFLMIIGVYFIVL